MGASSVICSRWESSALTPVKDFAVPLFHALKPTMCVKFCSASDELVALEKARESDQTASCAVTGSQLANLVSLRMVKVQTRWFLLAFQVARDGMTFPLGRYLT